MKNQLRRLFAVAAICLTPTLASAGAITFDFSSWGTATPTGSCGLFCYEIRTSGTVIEIGDNVPGTSSWSLSGVMQFLQIGSVLGIGAGLSPLGGGWSFIDATGSNSLFGSFTMLLEGGLNDDIRYGSVQYLIEGGTGLFEDASGLGLSVIAFDREGSLFSFIERGVMSALVSAQSIEVPEPGTLALFAAGMLAMLVLVHRRRARPGRCGVCVTSR